MDTLQNFKKIDPKRAGYLQFGLRAMIVLQILGYFFPEKGRQCIEGGPCACPRLNIRRGTSNRSQFLANDPTCVQLMGYI